MHSIPRSIERVASKESPASVLMFPSQHTCRLATVERFQQRKPPEEQKEESYEIHAKDLPKDILKRVKLCIERTYSCEASVYIHVLETGL